MVFTWKGRTVPAECSDRTDRSPHYANHVVLMRRGGEVRAVWAFEKLGSAENTADLCGGEVVPFVDNMVIS